jgi:GTP-binding protein YchF
LLCQIFVRRQEKEMQIGIVGLPGSSKTTIFNALTRSQAETNVFSSGQIETNTAIVNVPDPRVDRLNEMFHPRKTTYARIQYNDIAGLRTGIGQDGGLTGALLNAISQNDALMHVVRAFEDERVPHPDGSVSPLRDVSALDFEFLFSDLTIIERRMERLARDLSKRGRSSTGPEREEFDLLMRLKENLEQEIPIRDLVLTAQEQKQIRGYQFLTAKPVLVVLNIGDDGNNDPGSYLEYRHRQAEVICLRGNLEMEIAQLDPDEAQLFLQEYDIQEPGLNRLIRLSYDLLGLQSFFTVGEDEVRAWTISRGANAVEAAGAIHSDLARGFIRAERVSYADLIAVGSLAEARKQGSLRLEGRDYIVQDGDILTILFNV